MTLDQLENTLAILQVAIWVLIVLAAIFLLVAVFVFLRFNILTLLRQKPNVQGSAPAAIGIQSGSRSARPSQQLPRSSGRMQKEGTPGRGSNELTSSQSSNERAPRQDSNELIDTLRSPSNEPTSALRSPSNELTDILHSSSTTTLLDESPERASPAVLITSAQHSAPEAVLGECASFYQGTDENKGVDEHDNG
jgi:hypothetical protein